MSWTYRAFSGTDCAAEDARALQGRLIAEGWPWCADPDEQMLTPPAALRAALDLRGTNLAELARRRGVTRQAIYDRRRRAREESPPPMWSLSWVLDALDVAWHDGAALSSECVVSIEPDRRAARVPRSEPGGGIAVDGQLRPGVTVTVCLDCGAEIKSTKSHNCPGGTQ